MMLGLVTRLKKNKRRPNKSYGFISAYDGETYWFNLRGHDDLNVGDEVNFFGGFNEKGYVARNIQKVTENS